MCYTLSYLLSVPLIIYFKEHLFILNFRLGSSFLHHTKEDRCVTREYIDAVLRQLAPAGASAD